MGRPNSATSSTQTVLPPCVVSGKDAQSQYKLPPSAFNVRVQNNTEPREERKKKKASCPHLNGDKP